MTMNSTASFQCHLLAMFKHNEIAVMEENKLLQSNFASVLIFKDINSKFYHFFVEHLLALCKCYIDVNFQLCFISINTLHIFLHISANQQWQSDSSHNWHIYQGRRRPSAMAPFMLANFFICYPNLICNA